MRGGLGRSGFCFGEDCCCRLWVSLDIDDHHEDGDEDDAVGDSEETADNDFYDERDCSGEGW